MNARTKLRAEIAARIMPSRATYTAWGYEDRRIPFAKLAIALADAIIAEAERTETEHADTTTDKKTNAGKAQSREESNRVGVVWDATGIGGNVKTWCAV